MNNRSISDLLKGHEKVLLADDNSELRKMILKLLSQLGYDVISVNDGTEALQMPEEELRTVELVITDVVMPNIGGIELISSLRERYPKIKGLLISGYPSPTFRHTSILNESTVFLHKPFRPIELATRVRELLDRGELPGQK